MDEISGFFVLPSSDSIPDGLLRVYDDGAYCELWRGTRNGKIRCYKALKPGYRGRLLYENLLRKEFDAGYVLDHPGIRRYIALLNHPDLGNCIELEWVDGKRLDEVLETEGPLCKEESQRIAGEILAAVAYIHARNMVHQDLKPANILITHNGRHAKIIDFGFAQSDDTAFLKLRAGTQEYAAPELFSGAKVDCRADVYALGIILRQLGFTPRRVLRRCCAARPQERYQSVQALQQALNRRYPRFLAVLPVCAALLAVALIFRPSMKAVPDETTPLIPVPVESEIGSDFAAEVVRPINPPAVPAVAPTSAKAAADSLFRKAEELLSPALTGK